jgi:hypothetical protein
VPIEHLLTTIERALPQTQLNKNVLVESWKVEGLNRRGPSDPNEKGGDRQQYGHDGGGSVPKANQQYHGNEQRHRWLQEQRRPHSDTE